jgi:hypothetical protein
MVIWLLRLIGEVGITEVIVAEDITPTLVDGAELREAEDAELRTPEVALMVEGTVVMSGLGFRSLALIP